MSQNNDSANYTSETARREHKDEEDPRFGRGRRGNQEENGQGHDHNTDRKNDNSKGSNKDSNKPDPDSEKNHQNNPENSETPPEHPAHPENSETPPENPAHPENQNQDNTSKPDENNGQNNDEPEESGRGGKDNEFDGRGRDTQSDDGHGRDDQSDDGRGRDDRSEGGHWRDDKSDGGHWRDDKSDGRSERGEFDERDEEEECERPEPEKGEEECEPQNPELDQQGNSNHPNNSHHDFSDDGRDHSDRDSGHHLPPGGPQSEAPSYRPGFMERTSAYTLTFSNETMFEVVLGSLLILVSAVFLFIYMVKRQRRKTMRSQSPAQNLRFVTPNQNIATANFYQYYQKEGLIPTGTVVGYIPEGQFLQPDAKNVQNLKSFGRLPTQDEILDLS